MEAVEAVVHCRSVFCTFTHQTIEVGDLAVVVVLLFAYHQQVDFYLVIGFAQRHWYDFVIFIKTKHVDGQLILSLKHLHLTDLHWKAHSTDIQLILIGYVISDTVFIFIFCWM